jgi:hypothetical protein
MFYAEETSPSMLVKNKSISLWDFPVSVPSFFHAAYSPILHMEACLSKTKTHGTTSQKTITVEMNCDGLRYIPYLHPKP